jgi:integrase
MGAAHRKSIVKEAIDRLDDKMAIHQSRQEAKHAIRVEQGATWSVSTGKIHSFKTRSSYQEHIIRFVKWARQVHHVTSLAQLDPRAGELATAYLRQRLAESKSPYTLQAERAALRLFFGKRTLADAVDIPRRERAKITRSRGPKKHDRHFQPANWPELVHFLQATGLRRHEVRALRCCDVFCQDGKLFVHVRSGKGGLERDVPMLPGHEEEVLALIAGRDPNTLVFERIPKHMDVHSYRREYAQALYLQCSPGRSLPPPTGRLKRGDYDVEAVLQVSQALGHRRKDVVLRHYLR